MENAESFTLAENFLKMIEKESGYKCAELYIEQNEYKNIDIEENSIKYSEVGFDQGASIRIYNKKGSIGFAFTNNLSKKSLEKIIQTAIKTMKISSVDTDFKDLPNRSNLTDKITSNRCCRASSLNLSRPGRLSFNPDIISKYSSTFFHPLIFRY